MMKKIAVVGLVVALANSYAFGGIIGFDPPKIDIDPAEGTKGKFNVSLQSMTEFGGVFEGFTVIMGSADVTLQEFVFDAGVAPIFPLTSIFQPANPPVYASDIQIGGASFSGGTSPAFLLGSLTFDVTGLEFGPYEILVSSKRDGERSALSNSIFVGEIELLSGIGVINVIPEPATISLLGLAALALFRRRKSA